MGNHKCNKNDKNDNEEKSEHGDGKNICGQHSCSHIYERGSRPDYVSKYGAGCSLQLRRPRLSQMNQGSTPDTDTVWWNMHSVIFFSFFYFLLYSPTSGCFSSFCNPPNSDRDYQILNVLAWSFLSVRIHTGVGHTSNSESAQHFWLWIIMFLLWWDLNLRMWSPTLYQLSHPYFTYPYIIRLTPHTKSCKMPDMRKQVTKVGFLDSHNVLGVHWEPDGGESAEVKVHVVKSLGIALLLTPLQVEARHKVHRCICTQPPQYTDS